MVRSPESGLKKGPWTQEEDEKLVKYIKKHGHGSWRALPKLAGLNRCGKSCRLRWTNYLRPDIKRGKFSHEEEQTILHLHSILGNKWSTIASRLPGRTDNEVKNFWNTHLKKKLIQAGYDPMTHLPRTDIFSSFPGLLALANLKGLLDQHSLEEHVVRLQAEAVQMARVNQCLQYLFQTPQAPIVPSITTNSFHDFDIDTYNNLLKSIKDSTTTTTTNSTSSPQLDLSTTNSLQGIINDNSIPFSHLPDLQNFPTSNNYQTPMTTCKDKYANNMRNQENCDEFPFFCQEGSNPSSNSLWLPATSNPIPRDSASPTNNHLVDGSSSSPSYGVMDATSTPSVWDELLQDPNFYHEFA